jgi:hypothetical protein
MPRIYTASLKDGLVSAFPDHLPTQPDEFGATGYTPKAQVLDVLDALPTENGYASFFGTDLQLGQLPVDFVQDVIVLRTLHGVTLLAALCPKGLYISSPGSYEQATLTTVPTKPVTYGDELLLDSPWGFGAGWTEGPPGYLTHEPAQSATLTCSVAILAATAYRCTYAINARTKGSITISFGGQAKATITESGVFEPATTSSTSGLVITPTSDFDGTIALSLYIIPTDGTEPKELLPQLAWVDSTGWVTRVDNTYAHIEGEYPLVNSYVPTVGTAYRMVVTITGRSQGSIDFGFGGLQDRTFITETDALEGVALTADLLTIKPSPTFDGIISISFKVGNGTPTPPGAELLTPGAWDNDNKWVESSKGVFTHTAGKILPIWHNAAIVKGKEYKLEYTISASAGSVDLAVGGKSVSGVSASSTLDFTATSTAWLIITPTSAFVGSVECTLKQVKDTGKTEHLEHEATINLIKGGFAWIKVAFAEYGSPDPWERWTWAIVNNRILLYQSGIGAIIELTDGATDQVKVRYWNPVFIIGTYKVYKWIVHLELHPGDSMSNQVADFGVKVGSVSQAFTDKAHVRAQLPNLWKQKLAQFIGAKTVIIENT